MSIYTYTNTFHNCQFTYDMSTEIIHIVSIPAKRTIHF